MDLFSNSFKIISVAILLSVASWGYSQEFNVYPWLEFHHDGGKMPKRPKMPKGCVFDQFAMYGNPYSTLNPTFYCKIRGKLRNYDRDVEFMENILDEIGNDLFYLYMEHVAALDHRFLNVSSYKDIHAEWYKALSQLANGNVNAFLKQNSSITVNREIVSSKTYKATLTYDFNFREVVLALYDQISNRNNIGESRMKLYYSSLDEKLRKANPTTFIQSLPSRYYMGLSVVYPIHFYIQLPTLGSSRSPIDIDVIDIPKRKDRASYILQYHGNVFPAYLIR